jgi:cell fate regulator YaaT (PSP1 superfamily)
MRDLKAILRKATPEEIAAIPAKEVREGRALTLCQTKVRDLGLAMEITGAEFQFDGKKLTFYYTASKYVDFRNLVKGLFRVFGTRIWMVWYDGGAPVKDVYSRGTA